MNRQALADRIWADKSPGDREYQEDEFGFAEVKPGVMVLALADGMGGHIGGGVASQIAVNAFIGFVRRYFESPEQEPQKAAWQSFLEYALLEANAAIADRVRREPQLASMGCTLVGVLCDATDFAFVSVGDSPMYISRLEPNPRQGAPHIHRFNRVNDDHSMQPLIDRSRITGEPLATNLPRNMLRSALMGQDLDLEHMRAEHEMHSGCFPLQHPDRLFLASDGVLTLSEAQLALLMEGRVASPRAVVQQVLREVIEARRPGQDNIAVIVFEPPTVAAEKPSALRARSAEARRAEAATRPVREALERTVLIDREPSTVVLRGAERGWETDVTPDYREPRRRHHGPSSRHRFGIRDLLIVSILLLVLAGSVFFGLCDFTLREGPASQTPVPVRTGAPNQSRGDASTQPETRSPAVPPASSGEANAPKPDPNSPPAGGPP